MIGVVNLGHVGHIRGIHAVGVIGVAEIVDVGVIPMRVVVTVEITGTEATAVAGSILVSESA